MLRREGQNGAEQGQSQPTIPYSIAEPTLFCSFVGGRMCECEDGAAVQRVCSAIQPLLPTLLRFAHGHCTLLFVLLGLPKWIHFARIHSDMWFCSTTHNTGKQMRELQNCALVLPDRIKCIPKRLEVEHAKSTRQTLLQKRAPANHRVCRSTRDTFYESSVGHRWRCPTLTFMRPQIAHIQPLRHFVYFRPVRQSVSQSERTARKHSQSSSERANQIVEYLVETGAASNFSRSTPFGLAARRSKNPIAAD